MHHNFTTPFLAIHVPSIIFPLYPNLLATNLPLYEPATAPTFPSVPIKFCEF